MAVYLTTFCTKEELVNPLVVIPVIEKSKETIVKSLYEVTEEEDHDPLIKDGVDPQFDKPQLRETIS